MTLAELDQKIIWHPYTQHQISPLPIPIVKGQGPYLFDEQGRRYLDMISAWWVNLHGHCHPDIAKAIYDQALTLEHVAFAGFTHQPAVELAQQILALLPENFSKVFYSDNGATAIEAALKMAYQFWFNQGEKGRKKFIAFENGYHGDTFGAMALGKNTANFFNKFEDLLFEVKTFPFPATWISDNNAAAKEDEVLMMMSDYLESHHQEIAAVIIEPLLQGVGNMQMCRAEFLQKLEKLVRNFNILIIYDEVLTGFGRTGHYFACKKAHTNPDLICLAKGTTGGFLPLAMTVCHEKIYNTFLGDNFSKALAHGHSYTANPLGCAAGIASLKLLQAAETQEQIAAIEKIHEDRLTELMNKNLVDHARFCGTVAAFELKIPVEYGSNWSVKLRDEFLARGLLIRPLGNTIYLMPPYCISAEQLNFAYDAMQIRTKELI